MLLSLRRALSNPDFIDRARRAHRLLIAGLRATRGDDDTTIRKTLVKAIKDAVMQRGEFFREMPIRDVPGMRPANGVVSTAGVYLMVMVEFDACPNDGRSQESVFALFQRLLDEEMRRPEAAKV